MLALFSCVVLTFLY